MKKHILTKENLSKVKTIGIFGDTGTGKTALAYRIIKERGLKEVYFIKHPRPEVIEKLGFENLMNLEELDKLSDCLIFWDEPQLSSGIYDKKTNSIIAKVCSLSRQRNITIIIVSSDTRIFTKHNEAYIDLWLVKDCDFSMVKQRSKIWKIIKDNSILDPQGFRLEINEFLAESRKLKRINRKYTFELIKEWNDDLSKPYGLAKKSAK